MKKLSLLALTLGALLTLAACGDEHDHDDAAANNGHDHNNHDHNNASNNASNNHDHSNNASNNHDHSNNNALVDYAAKVQLACDAASGGGDPLSVTAGDTLETSAPVEIGAATRITLPAGGTGYITLTNTEDHTTWLLFTDQGDVLKGAYADGALQEPLASVPNQLCDGVLAGQTTLHVHEPMGYVIEIEGTGDLWFMAVLAEVGHNPDAEEEDHDHDHGGGGPSSLLPPPPPRSSPSSPHAFYPRLELPDDLRPVIVLNWATMMS